VQCWGSNAAGQLGDGSTKDRRVPGPVPGLAGATAILAAGDRTCARLQSGSVLCWGDDADGAIGGARPTPTAVTW
jgi:alpha-tubulin suppressor-like RCC1 family protein